MLGAIVVPKKRHDRLIKEKDNEIDSLKQRIDFLESGVELENYKQMHRKFKDSKNKEIENLNIELNNAKFDNKAKDNKLNEISYKLGCKSKQISELLLDNCDLQKKLDEKEKEVFVARTFLSIEADKTIKRYENIKKRTKKMKTKNKCERKIENYMMRKLAYEPK